MGCERVIRRSRLAPFEASMSYDLGVLNLASGRKKNRTKLYAAAAVVAVVVVVALLIVVFRPF